MKKLTKLLALLFVAALVLSVGVCALAAEEMTYEVRIFSGSQGTFVGGDTMISHTVKYGDRVSFSVNQVELADGSKYYVRGIRESGLDNDEVANTSFVVTRDIDYVVAYGILGTAVTYTVNYVDEAGNTLAPSETFYGNVGDKPVVAYAYIDGYQPQYYNITATLTADGANVFTFVYVPVATAAEETEETATETAAGEGETAAGETAGEAAGEAGEVPGAPAGETPAEPEEILDMDVPLAAPEQSETAESIGEGGVPGAGFASGGEGETKPNLTIPAIAAGAVIVAGGAVLAIIAIRKKKVATK